jgi:hypothetical protein
LVQEALPFVVDLVQPGSLGGLVAAVLSLSRHLINSVTLSLGHSELQFCSMVVTISNKTGPSFQG